MLGVRRLADLKTKKLKILQICPHDSAPFGELCAAYTQAGMLADAEVTTIILSAPDSTAVESFCYLGLKKHGTALTKLRTHRAVQGVDWDLVLCHRHRAYRAALWLAVPNAKIVVLAHEFDLLKSWRRRLFRSVFARKVRFGGVSPAVSKQLAQVTRFGLVLPNILDLDKFAERSLDAVSARRKLGLEGDGLTVGVVGRLHYKKRPAVALAAFQLFWKEILRDDVLPDEGLRADVLRADESARLVFLGSGDSKIKNHLRQAGAVVIDHVPNASSAFKGFDLLLHTGDVESFGMVILEAMVAGIPVVVAKGGGPEYVLGNLGFYPESDTAQGYSDAMVRALATVRALNADPDHLRDAGRQRAAQKFSIPALGSRLATLLNFADQPD